jgi:subtilase family serine protease
MRQRLLLSGAAFAIVAAAAATAIALAAGRGSSTVGQPGPAIAEPDLPLQQAMSSSRRLGPLPGDRLLELTLTLRQRHLAELRKLVEAGKSVTPAAYASRFGPDPRAVRTMLRAAGARGLATSWHAGDPIAGLKARASVISQLFDVSLQRFETAAGRRFFAAEGTVRRPRWMQATVSGVAGLESYSRRTTMSVPAGGVQPSDVLAFYDIKPLVAGGLSGAGETVVFPEIGGPIDTKDLARFASEHNLPPFDLTVKTNPSWGKPDKDVVEATMDVEIVHAIAPRAKLVVYFSSASWEKGSLAQAQANRDYPGAIISESLGGCEPGVTLAQRAQVAAVDLKAAALGSTHFVSSGDHGSYECGLSRHIAQSLPATLPSVTAVGGTSVFLNSTPGYGSEVVWGNPIEGWGGGGGVSSFYRRPAWQTGPGVVQQGSNGFRQVPDVAGLADENTPWNIFVYGANHPWGDGTSAAAPLWAGITALIDEKLRRDRLRPVGFANPAIYWIGARSGSFRPAPFHDVTVGNNFTYHAHPGWDFATGWGTPDAAGLLAAWERYRRPNSGTPGPTPPPSPQPPAPPPAATAAAGRYCGFTDQGKGVCFDVTPGGAGVRNLNTQSVVACTGGTTWTWTLTLTGTTAPIQSNLFFTYPFDGSLTSSSSSFANITAKYSFQGTLDTAGAASGTINLNRISFDYNGAHYDCSAAPYAWHAKLNA